MSIVHLLEEFSSVAQGSSVVLSDVSLEEQKLDSFEKGYAAGWEDSVKAGADSTIQVSADFAQNLRDLSFTYQEAHTAALNAMKPLLDQIIATILPSLVHQTLGLQITEQLNELARTQQVQCVEIHACPSNIPTLTHMLEEDMPMSISVVPEPTLAEGQVHIRFGSQEREINLSEVLDGINQAVESFFNETMKETA